METTAPAVSVLMCVHNASRFLKEALDSIVSQTFEDLECVVVDDGSTDDSWNILSQYSDSRLTTLRASHHGLTGALNTGLANCRGALIARMDADDVSVPNRIATQVRYLTLNPAVHIVCSDVLTINSDGIKTGQVIMKHLDNDVLRDGLLYRRIIKPIVHPTVMMRREVVERLRGYRNFVGAEDHDFWLRAVDLFCIRRVNSLLLKYRIHSDCVSYKNGLQQAASSCMSAVNYLVRARTGIDLFVEAPEVLSSLERVAYRRIATAVYPAANSFNIARSRIRCGFMVSGTARLGAGLVRHGLVAFPWYRARMFSQIVNMLVTAAELQLRQGSELPFKRERPNSGSRDGGSSLFCG
jgi:glycosyltransferase involved in cell wall biosynthesis